MHKQTKKKKRRKNSSSSNVHQPVSNINAEMEFSNNELDAYDTAVLTTSVEEIINDKIDAFRKAAAREAKHGITKDRYIVCDSNSIDPLHAYSIVFKAYCKALFLLQRAGTVQEYT